MLEGNLFPQNTASSTHALFINFGENEELLCLKLSEKLRSKEINTEVYPENTKIKKQFSYADTKQIPWVVIIGESERMNGTCQLKNMKTGVQTTVEIDNLADFILNHGI